MPTDTKKARDINTKLWYAKGLGFTIPCKHDATPLDTMQAASVKHCYRGRSIAFNDEKTICECERCKLKRA